MSCSFRLVGWCQSLVSKWAHRLTLDLYVSSNTTTNVPRFGGQLTGITNLRQKPSLPLPWLLSFLRCKGYSNWWPLIVWWWLWRVHCRAPSALYDEKLAFSIASDFCCSLLILNQILVVINIISKLTTMTRLEKNSLVVVMLCQTHH